MNNNDFENKSNSLRNEIAAAEALLSTLKNEFQLLNNRAEPAEIHKVAERKQRELLQMEKTTQQRTLLITTTDPLLTDEPLKSYWQTLLELAQACQHQNQLNGGIINIAKRHVEEASAILHGQQPTSELGYASSGKTVTASAPRSLAKA